MNIFNSCHWQVLRFAPSGLRSGPASNNDTGEERKTFQQLSVILIVVDGTQRLTPDNLLKAVLRHRPDRIIVGEVRGSEARTLLDAMNTGHRGTLATIHASSAEEAIHRLATLVMRGSNGLTLDTIKADVRRGIDLIVYIHRDQGKRRIGQVLDMHSEHPGP